MADDDPPAIDAIRFVEYDVGLLETMRYCIPLLRQLPAFKKGEHGITREQVCLVV